MDARIRVFLLLAAITALFIAVGNAIGGSGGIVIALVLAVVMNMGSYWFSDKLVLSMTRAQPVSPQEAPDLYRMVENLSRRADIPMPRLYIVPDPSPNAFATGRNPANGVVAVNAGLLNLLNHDELEGVVAHEIAHIKHRDTLTSAIVATLAGAISSLANIFMFASIFRGDEEGDGGLLGGLFAMLVAPIAATMIQLGVSRVREYEADKTAAQLTGKPLALRSALLRLSSGVEHVPGHMSPSASHLCIVNPFAGMGGLVNLFSTHPPIEKRAEKLAQMARAA